MRPLRAAPRTPAIAKTRSLRVISTFGPSGNRRLRPAPAQPEFPDQRVGRRAGDAHSSRVDAVQVVGGAEADLVGVVVSSTVRAVLDVVTMSGGTATARDQAAVAVASEDPVASGHPFLHMRLPDLDVVG